MDLVTGRRNRVPVAQVIRRTLKLIAPHARELGSEARARRHRGDPPPRQRRRPPAARLQREPRHRRGRPRDRRADRDRPVRRDRVGSRHARPSATGSRRRSSGRRRRRARRSSRSSPTARSCCSSISSTGRPPERTSSSSCVTGATNSAPRACSRTRSRATRPGRTSRGCRRSTSTSRCSPTGTPTRRSGFGVAFDYRGMKDVSERSAFLDRPRRASSAGAWRYDDVASCPTSTCCSKPRAPCSRPADPVYCGHGHSRHPHRRPARPGPLTAIARRRSCSSSAILFISQAGWATAWYSAFKAIHVLAAIVWIGGGALLTILGVARRAQERPGRDGDRRPAGGDGRREDLRAGRHRRGR